MQRIISQHVNNIIDGLWMKTFENIFISIFITDLKNGWNGLRWLMPLTLVQPTFHSTIWREICNMWGNYLLPVIVGQLFGIFIKLVSVAVWLECLHWTHSIYQKTNAAWVTFEKCLKIIQRVKSCRQNSSGALDICA